MGGGDEKGVEERGGDGEGEKNGGRREKTNVPVSPTVLARPPVAVPTVLAKPPRRPLLVSFLQ